MVQQSRDHQTADLAGLHVLMGPARRALRGHHDWPASLNAAKTVAAPGIPCSLPCSGYPGALVGEACCSFERQVPRPRSGPSSIHPASIQHIAISSSQATDAGWGGEARLHNVATSPPANKPSIENMQPQARSACRASNTVNYIAAYDGGLSSCIFFCHRSRPSGFCSNPGCMPLIPSFVG